MYLRPLSRLGLAIVLGFISAATGFAAAFTAGPATTCAVQAPGLGHNLQTPATGALSFTVINNIFVNTAAGAAPCLLSWTVEQALVVPAGMMINFAKLDGTVDVPAGGMVVSIRAQTDHSSEGGIGVATAMVGPFGPGVGIPFLTPLNAGAPFAHGAGADTLRQEMRIEITPGPAGGLFSFHFPVDSATEPIPEPATGALLLSGVLATALWRARTMRRI